MADIFKTTLCLALSWMKMLELRLKFLKCVPKDPINDILVLIQIKARRRPGDKPLSEQCWLVYRRIYAPLGLNEWIICLVSTLQTITMCMVWNHIKSKKKRKLHIGMFAVAYDIVHNGKIYRKTSNIRGIESPNLNFSRLVLQFS